MRELYYGMQCNMINDKYKNDNKLPLRPRLESSPVSSTPRIWSLASPRRTLTCYYYQYCQ